MVRLGSPALQSPHRQVLLLLGLLLSSSLLVSGQVALPPLSPAPAPQATIATSVLPNVSALNESANAAILATLNILRSAPQPAPPASNLPNISALNESANAAILATLNSIRSAPQPAPPSSDLPNASALNASATAAILATLTGVRGAPAPAPSQTNVSSLTLQQILNQLNQRVPATLGLGALGVTYGGQQAQPLPFSQVVTLLLRNNITAIRFLDPPNAEYLDALSNTGIQVSIMVPNNYIVYLSTNPDAARSWVNTWVGKYIGRVQFKYVVVGDTPLRLVYNCYYCAALPLTVASIQAAILELGLTTQVSVPLAANDVLDFAAGAWPPNTAAFNPVIGPTLLLILKTAFEANANLLVELDPYAIIQANTTIPLNMALGTAQMGDPGTFQLITGQNYTNIYDIYLDAIAYAATAFRFPTLNITVASTGWPTDGGGNATLANAQTYVNYVIQRALSNGGTPYRQSRVTELYLNEIIDQDLIELTDVPFPNGWQRHRGLFTPQGAPKFAANLRGTNAPPRPMNGLQDLIRLPTRFCVAKPGVPDTALLLQQIQACSGGADCTPFANGGSCFLPDTVAAHTSYAFNDYYQKHAQWSPACDFGGTAQLVTEDPSYGNCSFTGGVGLPGYGVPGTVRSAGGEGRVGFALRVAVTCLLSALLGHGLV
ncbi:O-Glycosyl hydrolases family 17 protein [Klebsormidium nitens]|uniref:O-Glycosyl hydrolases family 17 protein n=1 Tax=Klebsormidium nitens TaxID=105231 RepID=A0A1Y1HV29_KLENI|nr:O-Glycosyl hydrolases family 17 protein [Klebsormidium nitens]|eukprot:GAQ80396.1 O-Glycosyl hydrolases family 17 protein [Klebsormidium nitens]